MLFLASQSPRRRELLTQIAVRFSAISVSVPEQRDTAETPEDYVQRLAREKAHAGHEKSLGGLSLGADTIVVHRGDVLEKPENEADCMVMLQRLSDDTHEVLTAICLIDSENEQQALARTMVHFHPLSEETIRGYWRTGEPRDKAGAYGIQGLGAVFVKGIEGSYSAVVGLPLELLSPMLEKAGVPLWETQL